MLLLPSAVRASARELENPYTQASARSPVASCCVGQQIRLMVYGMDFLPIYKYNRSLPDRWSGWMVAFVKELELETGATFMLQENLRPLYLDLVEDPPKYTADAVAYRLTDPTLFVGTKGPVLGDGTASAPGLVYTAPFLQSRMTGAVLKTKAAPNLFAFMEPFSEDLWIAILLAIFGTVLVAMALDIASLSATEAKSRMRSPRRMLAELVSTSYHMWAT